jgi:hypothetical protein
MIEDMFSAPIPGESLTREPGNAPWEQPPHLEKVEHVAAFYIEKLEDDKNLEDLLDVLDKGMPIEHLVSSMLLYGEMEGEHTMDASMLVSPVLHEYIKFLAESAGISYTEFQGDEVEDPLVEDFNMMFSPEAPQSPMEEPEEIIEEESPPSRGLVKRRQ